jgi:hypothetical protein
MATATMWVAALAAIATTACSPCAGTSECRSNTRIAYSGRMVERRTERGVGGVRVTFVPTGGVRIAQDSIVTTSDGDGFFTLVADADAAGESVGNLTITPALPHQPYTVTGIRLSTTNVRGDGGELGRLVIDPYLALIGEVRDRISYSVVPNAFVTFRRTGGVAIDADSIVTQADQSGRFFLNTPAATVGTVTAEISIAATGYPRSFAIPLSIRTEYRDRPTPDIVLLRLGTTLLWVGEVHRRGNDTLTAGLLVEFDRTGGIPVQPSHFESRTNEVGRFALNPMPGAEGQVVGDLTIHPPPPFAAFVVRGVQLRTSDSVGFLGRWGYGQQVFSEVEFLNRTTGKPVGPGGIVLSRRTAGIQTDPEALVDTINGFGRSKIQMAALDSGEVTLDLEVRLGEPYGTEFIRGVRISSRNSDDQILYGSVSVGRWFPQIGLVRDRDTDQPIPDVRITFRRTGGIAIQPDPYIVAANPDGSFPIRPQPLSDGEVVGDLTISVPPPYRDSVITGLRLQTSMDDRLNVIGLWRFAKP